MFSLQLLITSLSFLPLSAARAVWIPDELQHDATFWVPEDFSPLARRADTCGGDSSLTQCGGDFPSDFCCGSGTQCLLLNTTSSIQAALCCPAGQDCQIIAPIGCDKGLQNATSNPTSQLHAQPPTELQSCGQSCCPMGYTCQNSVCQAQTKQQAASSSVLPTSTAGLTTSTGSSTTSATASSTSGASVTPLPVGSAKMESENDAFSGKSFAAGFVPGIILGLLAAGAIVFCLLRRDRRKSRSYVDEKHNSGRDTLTDLGPPTISRKPTFHGRSISEPTADASMGHRTEFLNFTPPRDENAGAQNGPTGYMMHVHSPPDTNPNPATGNNPAPKQKGWLSHSPFVNQARSPIPTHSPVPAHLKRGTLSFSISPVRALRKQRSMHSLRRQNQADRSNSKRSQQPRADVSRSDSTGSTETIKVLMDTPREHQYQPQQQSSQHPPRIPLPVNLSSTAQQQPQQQPASAAGTWATTTSSSPSPTSSPTPIDIDSTASSPTYTPTRPGCNSHIAAIGDTRHQLELLSPYTPSSYPPSKTQVTDFGITREQPGLGGLLHPGMAVRDSVWRNTCNTTFSAMMEKAGLRRTLLMGPDPREWNRSRK